MERLHDAIQTHILVDFNSSFFYRNIDQILVDFFRFLLFSRKFLCISGEKLKCVV